MVKINVGGGLGTRPASGCGGHGPQGSASGQTQLGLSLPVAGLGFKPLVSSVGNKKESETVEIDRETERDRKINR